MAYLKSSHMWVCAFSATTEAAVLLASWYLLSYSGVFWTNQSWRTSSFRSLSPLVTISWFLCFCHSSDLLFTSRSGYCCDGCFQSGPVRLLVPNCPVPDSKSSISSGGLEDLADFMNDFKVLIRNIYCLQFSSQSCWNVNEKWAWTSAVMKFLCREEDSRGETQQRCLCVCDSW